VIAVSLGYAPSKKPVLWIHFLMLPCRRWFEFVPSWFDGNLGGLDERLKSTNK